MFIKNIQFRKSKNNNPMLSLGEYRKLSYKLIKKSKFYQKRFLYDADLMSNITSEIAIADHTFDENKGPTLNSYRISRINWEICKFIDQQENNNTEQISYYDKGRLSSNSKELEECINVAPLSIQEKSILRSKLFYNENYSEIGTKLNMSGQNVKNIFVSAAQKIYNRYIK